MAAYPVDEDNFANLRHYILGILDLDRIDVDELAPQIHNFLRENEININTIPREYNMDDVYFGRIGTDGHILDYVNNIDVFRVLTSLGAVHPDPVRLFIGFDDSDRDNSDPELLRYLIDHGYITIADLNQKSQNYVNSFFRILTRYNRRYGVDRIKYLFDNGLLMNDKTLRAILLLHESIAIPLLHYVMENGLVGPLNESVALIQYRIYQNEVEKQSMIEKLEVEKRSMIEKFDKRIQEQVDLRELLVSYWNDDSIHHQRRNAVANHRLSDDHLPDINRMIADYTHSAQRPRQIRHVGDLGQGFNADEYDEAEYRARHEQRRQRREQEREREEREEREYIESQKRKRDEDSDEEKDLSD